MAKQPGDVELNHKAIGDALRSAVVLAELERRGRNMADAAGEGFTIDGEVGRNRARVTVYPETGEAAYAEAADQVLTKAIGAART